MPQERGSAKGDDMSATDSPVVKAILAQPMAFIALTGLIASVVSFWQIRDNDITRIASSIAVIEQGRKENLPRLDALERFQIGQQSRMESMAAGIQQLRAANESTDAVQAKALNDILVKLGDVREAQARTSAIVERIERDLQRNKQP